MTNPLRTNTRCQPRVRGEESSRLLAHPQLPPQPFLTATTHSQMPRITVHPQTSIIVVDDLPTRELTTPPPPQPTYTATPGSRRMDNTIAAPVGRFAPLDNRQQKEDGAYPGESHSLTRIGSRRPPPRPQPTSTTTPGRRRMDQTILAGHFPLLQNSINRIASNPFNQGKRS